MQKKWYLQSEMIIAFSALLTSLVAVVVAIYSAWIDRSYAKASVWPSILLSRSYSGNEYAYLVMNQGNGPAIVHYMKLYANGSLVHEWQDVFNQAGVKVPNNLQSHVGSGIIRAGQTVEAIKFSEKSALLAFLKVKLNAELCFCSIYDDCWISEGFRTPREVDSCTIKESERFLE